MSLTQWLQKFVAKTPRGGTKSIPPLGLRAARLHFEPLEERRVFSVTPTLNGNVLEILLDADGDTATLRTEDLDANATNELNVYDQTDTLVGTFDFGTFESITFTGDGGNGGVQTVVFENTIPLALAGDLSANGGDIESIEFQGDMALGGLLDLAVGESIELGAGADLSADAGMFVFAIGSTLPTNISMDATSSLTTLGGIVILASEGSVTAGSLTADSLISVNGSTGITFQNDVTFTSATTADFQVNADQGDVTIDGDILTPNATGGSFMLYLDAGLGTAGTLFLNGDIHAPPAAGQITVDGNLTLGSGFSFDQLLLTGTTLGGPYDTVGSSILVTGANRTVDLGGAMFTFSRELGYLPQVGDEFGVITLADASSVITGSFTNRAEGDEFYSDDVRYEFSQAGGDGNDVALTILSPTTVWVDEAFAASTPGDDPAGPAAIFGYDGFATVQGGVTQVADTGLANVANGSYNESVSVTGKSLTLRGEGAGTTDITSGGTAFTASNASFLTIEELTLNGTTALDVGSVDTTTLTNITTVGTASVTGLDLVLISDGSDDDIFSVGDDGITTSGLLNIAYLTTTVDNIDLQSGDGDDQFFIRPQPSTVITLDGGNGNDALEADFYQLFDFADTPGIPGSGVLTAYDRELAAYSSIETVTTSIVPDATLEAQFPDDGMPDNWLVKRSDSDPAILEVYVNGVLAFQQDYASTTKLTINGSTDDDTLTVDLTNGDIQLADGIHFNGGDGTDAVVLVSANDVTKVTHTFTSDTEGSIEIVGLSSDLTTISYTGLDPIVDNLSAATREFIFTGGDETISLTDDAAAGYNLIDSSLGESVLFLNPTDTLIITVQEGDDTFTAGSLDAGFAANILVSMDDVNNVAGDALVWNANAILGSVGVAGTFELAVAGGTISVNAAVNNTAGGGSFVLDASGNITQQGSLTTNSDITIESTGGVVTTATLAANDVLSEITITGTSIILAGDVTSANLVDITATTGSIEQTGGTVNSPTLSLDAQTGIFGTTAMVARAMDISAGIITATTNTGGVQLENAATAATTATLTATSGDILFNQTGSQSLTLANVATSGNASLANDAALTLNSALISGSGELTLDGTQVILGGNITANGQATITASDTITQLAGILTSPILMLDAQNGIGLAADAMEISTSEVTATTAAGGIFLGNAATAATTATLDATAGDIVLTQTGNQTLTVNSVTTGDGDINVSNTGAHLTVTTAEARGGDGNITLTTITAGNLLLGDVDADGAIVLTGAGGVVVDGAGHITTDGVGRTITVNSNLTTAGDLTTNDGQITIQGDLILAGSVLINSNSSGSGTGADVSVNGPNGIDLDTFTLTINAGPSGNVQTSVVDGDPTSSLVITNAHDVTIGAGGLTTGSAMLDLGGDFTNSGITSVSGLIQVTAGGDILFQDTIDAGSVDLAAGEDISLNDDLTAATSVKAVANADSALAAGVLTTKAIITTNATSSIELRGDAVELGGDITTGAAVGSTVLVAAGTGAITQTAGTITAPVLTLESQTGIGVMGNLLEISTGNLTATTAAGGIFLGNTATQATSAALTATAGNIVLTQTGGQNLTLTSFTATSGDATLTNDDAIEIQQASVMGTGRLEIEGTSVTLDGDVTAANSVHIVATSGAVIQTAGTITTADLGLFATGAIGATGQRIQTDAARLAARSTGGNLFLTNAGDLEIGGATFDTFTGASAANIDVLVETGSLNVTADIVATAAVTLESDATIGMASGTSITATSATLTAVGNITLAEIVAGTIEVTSTGGSIQDVDVSDSAVNLNAGAGSITLAAATGIGTTGGAAG
ncbi:MAG: hypothetical protein C0478_02060, partial [Planctomyces sp.]|nr:hypothetical protein [Planctomyces sp.]